MEKTNPEIQPTLVVQSFGKESEYRRALFCMLSYWAHCGLRQCMLFTDNPAYFKSQLPTFDLDIVLLTPEKIKTMRGAIDFLHRMKIALLEEAFQKTNGPLLYVDSDTFFVANPLPLAKRLSPQTAFMHKFEYNFNYLKSMPLPAGEPFQAFYQLITQKIFIGHDKQQIQVTPQMASWNAGVMFFHPSHRTFIPDVYTLTDQFYPATNNHASEQYAFSIMLQTKTQLEACDSVIYHYWYRVEKTIMDAMLNNFFQTAHQDLDQLRTDVLTLTHSLPALIQNHILTLRDNAIQAFHTNDFRKGFGFAMRAILKNPWNKKFLLDVGYHAKRGIKKLLRNGRTD